MFEISPTFGYVSNNDSDDKNNGVNPRVAHGEGNYQEKASKK